MPDLKLLFVEDVRSTLDDCKATIKRYSREKGRGIELVEALNPSEAFEKLNTTFDGAIIDLNLGLREDEGNDVIREIVSKYRIPVAVLTALPQNAQAAVPYLGVFVKGEIGYDELFDLFYLAYDTGITKILGGRGYLEDAMSRVYWNNILPQFEDWKSYRTRGKDTEKALLRFIINHIVELIDEDTEKYFLEEMYIAPVISSSIKTGGIVKKLGTDQCYVILSPACDLALHKGNFKTDRIMVCLIEKTDMNLVQNARKDIETEVLEADDEERKKIKSDQIEKGKRTLDQLQGNNFPYFHYLPKTRVFHGGFVNFRKIETLLPSEFKKVFEDPLAQISSAFTKDIVARFSSYYARQGQPDFDFDNHVL